jgi:putative membrane protein
MNKLRSSLITILQGSVMGVAEVIPGVSGSTLALIMGIYDDFILLLHQISTFIKEIAKLLIGRSNLKRIKNEFVGINFAFGIKLFTGMFITVLVFSNVLTYMFETYPHYLLALFFGIILASIQVPLKRINPVTTKEILFILITAVVFFVIFGLKTTTQLESAPLWYIFIGGVIGISGMVLPGISGSFLLYLLGIYELVISSVSALTKMQFNPENIQRIAVFGFGLITGFVTFIRIVKYALVHKHNLIMAFVTGLLIASLRAVWPYGDGSANINLYLITLITILSFLLTAAFIRFSKPEKELKIENS